MTSPSSSQQQPPTAVIEDLDWEEWDSTTGLSFTHHCLAGSFAGVAEHTLLYPLDTVKTCWQSQVLHRAASAGGAGGANNTIAAGCDPCSVHQTVHKLSKSASSAAAVGGNSSPQHHQQQQQGIWSTMKHLMRHGSYHHHHAHGNVASQLSTTMGANTSQLAPNVVDLTNNTTTSKFVNSSSSSSSVASSKNLSSSSSSSTTTSNNKRSGGDGNSTKKQRPWSKSARIVRGATLTDIAPSLQPSLYHSSATSSSSSSSIGGVHPHQSTITAPTNITTTNNNNTGFKRLWRGVQTMFVGCIPAHALYFSSYEGIKSVCLDHNTTNHNHHHNNNSSNTHENESSQQHHVGIDTLSPLQAMFAGGIATLLHDFIMTPMDTMKQRMQLGHYSNLRDAFCSIVWGDRRFVAGSATSGSGRGGGSSGSIANTIKEGVRTGGEGWTGLYRSFPITVMTNVPYGMIMMTTNEWLRAVLEDGLYGFHEHHHGDEKPFHFATILFSGMGAGMVASAVTAPLDRVKTRLQTQRMGMIIPSIVEGGGGGVSRGSGGGGGGGRGAVIMEERALAAAMGERKVCPKMAVQDVKSALFPSTSSPSSSSVASSSSTSIGGSTGGAFIQRPPPSTSIGQSPFTKTYYTTPIEAFQSIIQEEGPRGLFRGTFPRVALHAPSVAISWTAYEMAKGWLLWAQ